MLTLGLLFVAFAQAGIEAHFSPEGGCQKMVMQLIQQSQTSIDAAVYSFNNPALVNALLSAHRRGVKVRLLLDRTQAAGKSNRAILAQLRAEHLNFRLHSKNRIEHNKFGIFDHRKVSTGSFNWTEPAEHKNSENCLALDQSDIVAQYSKHFEDVLWVQNTETKSHLAIQRLLPSLRAPASTLPQD